MKQFTLRIHYSRLYVDISVVQIPINGVKHVFSYENKKARSNINTYFYRFEFQQQGTVLVHLLVWLKNLKMIQHNLIRADIPWEDPNLAFLVNKLQQSDKGAVECNESATQFVMHIGSCVLQLYHSQEAFAINLRCYLSTLLPELRCQMDLQLSNGIANPQPHKGGNTLQSLFSTHLLFAMNFFLQDLLMN